MAHEKVGVTPNGVPYSETILDVGEEIEFVDQIGATIIVRGLEQVPDDIAEKHRIKPDRVRVKSVRPYTDEVGPDIRRDVVYFEGSFATNQRNGSIRIFSRASSQTQAAVDGE